MQNYLLKKDPEPQDRYIDSLPAQMHRSLFSFFPSPRLRLLLTTARTHVLLVLTLILLLLLLLLRLCSLACLGSILSSLLQLPPISGGRPTTL